MPKKIKVRFFKPIKVINMDYLFLDVNTSVDPDTFQMEIPIEAKPVVP